MSLNRFNHVKISGLSVVVPEKEINIYDEVEYYGNDVRKVDRMKKTVGFFKRRVIEDGTTSADLAISAAENLLNEMNIDRQSIDGLVYVVQKQDYGVVDSYYIHHKLGLKSGTFCTNISQGCARWRVSLPFGAPHPPSWLWPSWIRSYSCSYSWLGSLSFPSPLSCRDPPYGAGCPSRDCLSIGCRSASRQ